MWDFSGILNWVSETFTPIAVSAASQAAYGAAIGAGLAAVTGGDVGKGALYGAGAGAISGGVAGALGRGSDPLGILDETTTPAGTQAPNPVPETADGGLGWNNPGNVADEASSAAAYDPSEVSNAVAAPATTATAATPASASTGVFDKGGWVERNGKLLGGAVGGIGKGLLAGMAAGEKADATRYAADAAAKAKAEEAARIAANYRGTGAGLLKRNTIPSESQRPTPKDRFDPRMYTGRYQWDPQQGRIVQIPA